MQKIVLIIVVAPVTIYVLHRLMLWMEKRDWIYYRRIRPKESMRSALNVFDELVRPEVRHVWEDKQQRAAESGEKDASGR